MSELESGPDALGERIIETAIDVAQDSGWYDLRLHLVAQRLGVPLEAVLIQFRDADAIADAWFARALQAMLREPAPGFDSLLPSERVAVVLMRSFDVQSTHRRAVGSMIGAKLHPSHPHHWIPMIFSLSRLIHWVLEAARLDARGLSRQAEEVGLTLLFLRALGPMAERREPWPRAHQGPSTAEPRMDGQTASARSIRISRKWLNPRVRIYAHASLPSPSLH